MSTGTVRSFDPRLGAGFITPDAGGADIFVHASEVERAGFSTLAVGERLNYDLKIDRALKRSFAVKLARGSV